MLQGTLYVFTDRDPGDSELYKHYMSGHEILKLIELFFHHPDMKDNRSKYSKIYGTDVMADTVDMYETGEVDVDQVKKCFAALGINDLEKVTVDEPVQKQYKLTDGEWVPMKNEDESYQ